MSTTAVHLVWFVALAPGRPESGPLRTSELKAMAADGRLQPDMLVRRIGMPRAVPAAQVKGLFTAAIAPPDAPTLRASPPADDETRPPDAARVPVSTPATPPTAILGSARRAVRSRRATPPSRAPRAADAANPYAPPTDAGAPLQEADGRRPAGFWLRVAALLLDTIATSLIVVFVVLMAIAAGQVWLMPAAFLVFPLYRVVLDARGGTWGKRIVGVRVVNSAGAPIGLGRAMVRHLHFVIDAVIREAACASALATITHGGTTAVGAVLPATAMLNAIGLLVGGYWLTSCLCMPFDARKRALHDRLAGSRCVIGEAPRTRTRRVAARRPTADLAAARIVAPSDPPTAPTARVRRPATTRQAARRAG